MGDAEKRGVALGRIALAAEIESNPQKVPEEIACTLVVVLEIESISHTRRIACFLRGNSYSKK